MSASSNLPGSGSQSLSPNHPSNLRKQAQPQLDSSFSVKSYIGAANALLEKAQAADMQGQLEVAFVNYLKAAGVASFISKHDDWPKIQRSRGQSFQAYNELMQQAPSFIARTRRIEEQLRVREEQYSSLRNQASEAAKEVPAAASESPSTPSPTGSARRGSPSSSGPLHSESSPSTSNDSSTLAQRLQALRGVGVQEGMKDVSGSGVRKQNSQISNLVANSDSMDDNASSIAQQPKPPVPRGANTSPQLPGDESFSMQAVTSALRDADGRSGNGLKLGIENPEEGQSSLVVSQKEVAQTPDFENYFPSLHDFERSGGGMSAIKPGSSNAAWDPVESASSQVGTTRTKRPLPEPPSLGKSFDSSTTLGDGVKPAKSRANGVASLREPYALQEASTSERPNSLPRSVIVGAKPELPLSNHLSVEQLWSFMNPGYEQFVDQDGVPRIGKKMGLQILLLDIRSRRESDEGRIRGAQGVCIEPITLRPGMSSSDIEDKLLLSPKQELEDFLNRDKFDLVVLYDQRSKSLGHPTRAGSDMSQSSADKDQNHLRVVVSAIYENEFRKPLKHQPVVLIGGFEAWIKNVGSKGVIRQETDREATLVNGSGIGATNGQVPQEDQDVKQIRRQAQSLVNGDQGFIYQLSSSGLANDPVCGTGVKSDSNDQRLLGYHPQPPSPPTASNTRSFNASLQSFSPPSIPARIYQSPGSSAAAQNLRVNMNEPFRVDAPSRKGTGSFDYPQLRQRDSTLPTPQPPPAAVPSVAPTSAMRGHRGHAVSQSLQMPGAPFAQPTAPADHAVRLPSTKSTSHPPSSTSRIMRPPAVDDIRIGLTGLKNLGNSCYMNSTLQCLSATIPLARFLLDGSYKQAINRVNPLGTQGALAEAFAQLVRVMWSEQYTFVSPVTFREAIARFAPAFRGSDQHDSQEFLAFLLDGLHEDLNYVVHKPAPIEMTPEREAELESLPQQIASVKEWSIYRMRNDSLIVDWFQGQFRNKMTCLTCGKTSTTYNAFMYLSLPIPNGRGMNRVTLQQCLDAFVREEIMDKSDAWRCPRCKRPRKATKKLSISRLPQVLLIHLKRFSFKGPFTDKIDTQVTFPTSSLDLTNYMPPPLPPGAITEGVATSQSQQPPYIYDLYGVTHHFGSLNTGHYTATIRNHGEWWYCDDSRVTKGDDRQIKTNSPYVLWFRRRPNE
ncbi:cysteine proteinase [Violaceomyces palustris]|uniref:Cysteine proteinase n=1 Tax=Violaceomyces palustris TaxID=1673888 RepID=A0ACD0NXD9_9BASI|nr:cysteine proteinase [Violaceomyces palustris]